MLLPAAGRLLTDFGVNDGNVRCVSGVKLVVKPKSNTKRMSLTNMEKCA